MELPQTGMRNWRPWRISTSVMATDPATRRAPALSEDNATQAHVGSFRSAGIAGASLGQAGRHEQGGRADDGGLSEEDRLKPARPCRARRR